MAPAYSAADPITYDYNFLTPAAVTGDPGNLGAVSFATTSGGHESSANVTVTAATLAAATSAPDNAPDVFSGQTYKLSLQLTDDTSGNAGTLTFVGKLFGTLSSQKAAITTSFVAPTQTMNLGTFLYTVSIAPIVSSTNPTLVGTLNATIEAKVSDGFLTEAFESPEPPALALAAIGLGPALWCGCRHMRKEDGHDSGRLL
jgi:hypothetical protein